MVSNDRQMYGHICQHKCLNGPLRLDVLQPHLTNANDCRNACAIHCIGYSLAVSQSVKEIQEIITAMIHHNCAGVVNIYNISVPVQHQFNARSKMGSYFARVWPSIYCRIMNLDLRHDSSVATEFR